MLWFIQYLTSLCSNLNCFFILFYRCCMVCTQKMPLSNLKLKVSSFSNGESCLHCAKRQYLCQLCLACLIITKWFWTHECLTGMHTRRSRQLQLQLVSRRQFWLRSNEFKCFFRTVTIINDSRTQLTPSPTYVSTVFVNITGDWHQFCYVTALAMPYSSLSGMKSVFECQKQTIGLASYSQTFSVGPWYYFF